MKINQKGFSIVEILLVVVILGLIGGTGYYVYNSQKKTNTALDNTANSQSEPQKSEEKKEEEQAEKVTYTPFSVTTSEKLKDKGSCKTGEVLFAPIFNSDSFDYDCHSLEQATEYASIVFGQSDKSIPEQLGKADAKSEDVELPNKSQVKKYIVEAPKKGHGGGDFTAQYVIYQVESSNGKFFYALYWSGKGFSDENHFLDDFNSLVANNWQLK